MDNDDSRSLSAEDAKWVLSVLKAPPTEAVGATNLTSASSSGTFPADHPGSDHELRICNTAEHKVETIAVPRRRSENWRAGEIRALLKLKVDAQEEVVDKPPWDFISEGLKRQGFTRSPKECENRWGTLLKLRTAVQTYVQANKIPGTSSSWVNIWNMDVNERSKNNLPRMFTLEWYDMMEKIDYHKPRKKAHGKKQMVTSHPSVSLTHLSGPLASSGTGHLASTSTPLMQDDNSIMGPGDEKQTEDQRPGMMVATGSALNFNSMHEVDERRRSTNEQSLKVISKQIELIRETMKEIEFKFQLMNADGYVHRRPRKSRKKNT